MEQAVMSMFRMSLDGLEGRSRDWPKFSGKVLGYAVWKKEWQRHHQDKYRDLKGDSLKRIMLERCLPEEVKERVLYKRTIEDIWKYLDTAYNRPDVFLHDLMEPVRSAEMVAAEDWTSLEQHMDLLRRTFEHADDARMTAVVLHHNNLEVMYGKWPAREQTKWWKRAATVDPLDQPLVFRKYVEERYDVVAMLASQQSIRGGGRREAEKRVETEKPKWAQPVPGKAAVNAAPVAVPAARPAVRGPPAAKRPPRPCALAAEGCKEEHPVYACQMFKSWT
jgi:hypothetical protein